jgi:F0F1-type ATP synthase assembly protein I
MFPNPLRKSPLPDDTDRGGDSAPRDSLHDPLQMGITIVGVTAVFGSAGWWLDKRLHTFPILLVIGAVVGLAGIIYVTSRRLKESDRPPQGSESSGHESK